MIVVLMGGNEGVEFEDCDSIINYRHAHEFEKRVGSDYIKID